MINTYHPSLQAPSSHSPLSVVATIRALRPSHSPLPRHLLLSSCALFAGCVLLESRLCRGSAVFREQENIEKGGLWERRIWGDIEGGEWRLEVEAVGKEHTRGVGPVLTN